MSHRHRLALSAVCGMGWAAIAVLLMLISGPRSNTLSRMVWDVRGGIVIAPLIGIAVGSCWRVFARLTFAGRAAYAVSTLYLAAFLFLFAASAVNAASHHSPSVLILVSNSFNAAIWGLTWTGFVVILGPISFLNH